MIDTCDKVIIHIVDDAYVDMLSNSQQLSGNRGVVRRYGLNHHFLPGSQPVKADGGICLVVDIFKGDRCKRILVDGGYSSDVVLHNMKILGIDPSTINVAMLSHGHPDHLTGLAEVLAAVGHPVPLYVHPDAFIPRSIMQGGFSLDYINRDLRVDVLEAAGARIIPLASPIELAPGFLYTGQIERLENFEREVPKGRTRICDGCLAVDDILDDVGFVCNIKNKGLLVATMCGHAGIISTVRYCQELTGIDQVFGVIGGFHLGHAAVSNEKINLTIQALKDLDVKVAAPFHCSGMITRLRAAEAIPNAYVGVGAATVIEL